jgi:glutamine amidotransferase
VISIINYKSGNLNNVLKAFINFGFKAKITSDPDEIKSSDGVVLPGVGAFGDAITIMNETGFSEAVREYIKTGKPFLGICIGLQLLFEESEEFGGHKGLGVFKGKVKRFNGDDLIIPHMGVESG